MAWQTIISNSASNGFITLFYGINSIFAYNLITLPVNA